MEPSRRHFLAGSIAGAVGAGAHASAATPSAAAPGKRPNILVVVLDDVGFADLGCFGSELATPAIDGLARGGARFNNFHTAPLCSPTRAALLTGCNPHTVGVGTIADWADSRPGYAGAVALDRPMLAELLGRQGYGCYATGKWHLNPVAEQGTAGPYAQWPTRRGFDRWYGFHGANADQWHPELFEGTSAIDPPERADYHLSGDLVDRMIGYLGDHTACAPERPFFGYIALGACHWPQQVPKAAVDRLKARYDGGWGLLRGERFARQKAIGLVPPEAELPPENPDVPVWESLSADDRRFAARCMAVYGGFLEHADAQIARLLSALDDMGVRDDTIVVLLSDNGATAEGGPVGLGDVRRDLYMEPETADDRAQILGALGSDRSFPAYPLGWASASNTPLKWYKSTTHEGGIRTPLIVAWPGRVAAGLTLPQYHHVSDVAPTLFELAGLPRTGLEGTSFAYALADPAAATRKRAQIFESTGSRALWQDGWKAVTRHVAGEDFARDRWELYHSAVDFSEAHDLAAAEPVRLAAMQAEWQRLAGLGNILPLSDSRLNRYRANLPQRRVRYRLLPYGSRIDRLSMPDARRPHRIVATVVLGHTPEGVILAAGTALRGYELFIRGGELVYVYVAAPGRVLRVAAGRLPSGPCLLGVELGDGSVARDVRLTVDGVVRATGRIDRSWPVYAAGAGLRCGANRGAPISGDYAGSFVFRGGRIGHVDVEMG